MVENVFFLSESSQKLLEFMNGKVMEDYKGMTEVAGMYEQDAVFYSDISGNLGESSKELSGYFQDMKLSAENSNENSRAVLMQMEELSQLSEMLNETVASFKV